MHDDATMKSERSLRELIERNLRKEIHSGTKPSVDFIHKILDDAHKSGMIYDVSDMRPKIMAFANNSTHQPLEALKMVQKMQWKSEETAEAGESTTSAKTGKDDRLVFYDVEVYPNLFVVCWKYEGDDNVVRMINPSSRDIEALFSYKLVGFNNRRYDNHILYARFMGYDNKALYELSQKIIDNTRSGTFGEGYGLSYADIYDFSSKKQSLKKFEIELGIHHMEMDIPWDEPVDEKLWDSVVEYCVNDVKATEAVFEARKADFVARQILADLSGLTVNDTTQKHTAKILFGNDRNASEKFVYTDLSEMFPGYTFDMGKSHYKGEEVGEGGYVYAEPGIYEDVTLLDVASMHPASIENLNLFGDEYTQKFSELKKARIAIKHRDYDEAREMLDGKLAPYLEDESMAKDLSYALKIVINIVYGLTSAKFDNPFRDKRNKDNIVAKRGALFMIDLKEFVQGKGFTVAHIKTDSIKIPGATPELIQEVMEFGQKYGYDFEHEATYSKFCLVNEAVYVAKDGDHWSATGAQFQHSYVFKTLFSKEEVEFSDLCEARSVSKGTMYLDFGDDEPMYKARTGRHHIGKTGLFVPVVEGAGGGTLLRVAEEKDYAVAGTKGYRWLEAEYLRAKEDFNIDDVDMSYFESLADEAVDTINKFGSYEELVK